MVESVAVAPGSGKRSGVWGAAPKKPLLFGEGVWGWIEGMWLGLGGGQPSSWCYVQKVLGGVMEVGGGEQIGRAHV